MPIKKLAFTAIAVGVMAGFGVMGYTLALEFVIAQLDA